MLRRAEDKNTIRTRNEQTKSGQRSTFRLFKEIQENIWP